MSLDLRGKREKVDEPWLCDGCGWIELWGMDCSYWRNWCLLMVTHSLLVFCPLLCVITISTILDFITILFQWETFHFFQFLASTFDHILLTLSPLFLFFSIPSSNWSLLQEFWQIPVLKHVFNHSCQIHWTLEPDRILSNSSTTKPNIILIWSSKAEQTQQLTCARHLEFWFSMHII